MSETAAGTKIETRQFENTKRIMRIYPGFHECERQQRNDPERQFKISSEYFFHAFSFI